MNNTPASPLISANTVRRAIGLLGISLPAVMIAGSMLIGDCTLIQSSISHYYFTIMGDVFVSFLIATGVLLISYKGYSTHDNIATTFCGLCAICIAWFPTSNNKDVECAIRTLADSGLRTDVHYFAAALYYCTLAYIPLFLFTKSAGALTKQKRTRNMVYRLCGITVLISILLIFFEDDIPLLNTEGFKPTFWLEWVANLAYGGSWLIKGGLFLRDEEAVIAQ